FYDSNDDGVGDFCGLAQKLDYIKDLGVNAIWLLPFYESPLRDDGYDISDYQAINPAYGTLDDFREFVAAAHARGIRIIIELVVNHSSDQHPWFQRARNAARGSPERDYYVWSDTGDEFEEARGLLQLIRAEVERHRPDAVLLAEANQPPENTLGYFGQGDECHMAFHFPLMLRLFMALAQEDRTPIVDIVEQTRSLPEGCQWALFLRNHDELTLEMVTEEERKYLWHVYATHRRLRINLGIRRRLATLLNGDRRRIELMNSLLFSLNGSPVTYYGDEIGMGDNPFLGDRDGVRTPMQWAADRNAGFS